MAAGGGCRLKSLVFVFHIVLLFCLSASATYLQSILPSDENSFFSAEGGTRPLQVVGEAELTLLLIGGDFKKDTQVFFTLSETSCNQYNDGRTNAFAVKDIKDGSASLDVVLRTLTDTGDVYFTCLYDNSTGQADHSGTDPWVTIQVVASPTEGTGYLMPLWIQITIIAVLLMLSGLFSGLNLGLMSLDKTELEIIEKVGTEKEKHYARVIAPLRKRGNLLLCTLLLGNVMVNNTGTILIENLSNGTMAVIVSTIGIVIFGEIIPQAICSRHGLAVGAKTHWLTKIFMVLTFPASFPISLILDKILGEEMGQVYDKERLQELIRLNADKEVLKMNEANIISGALQLNNKRVEDIMTKIEDVYMLDISTVLDFETMTEILRHGYTRIPVHDGDKTNIVNLLNTKDLALIDPDDNTLLSTVCKYYDHQPLLADYDTKLDVMLNDFLHGNSHMAIVQKLHNAGPGDPYFEKLGVVTLEDVIEEILQSEIVDETDMMTDNRKKEYRTRKNREYGDLPGENNQGSRFKLPRQLGFVAFQYLATNIEPFSENYMSRNVLKNLLKRNIVFNVRCTEGKEKQSYIYQKGVATDKFVLILQGNVEVTIGQGNMTFESGPFSHYGVEALSGMEELSPAKEFVPDFSVKAISDVQYLCITQANYLSALHATRMYRQSGSLGSDVDHVSNHNLNSVFASHSPPPLNSPLESLKGNNRASSLDRLAFFQRKPDPHEILNRMRRTGSDAKERCVDHHATDPRKHSMDSARPSNSAISSASESPRKLISDQTGKNAPHILQPAPKVENKKLAILPEAENGVKDLNSTTKPVKSGGADKLAKVNTETQTNDAGLVEVVVEQGEGAADDDDDVVGGGGKQRGKMLGNSYSPQGAGDHEMVAVKNSEREPLMLNEGEQLSTVKL